MDQWSIDDIIIGQSTEHEPIEPLRLVVVTRDVESGSSANRNQVKPLFLRVTHQLIYFGF